MIASNCFESVGERRLTMLEEQGLSMNDLLRGKATDLFTRIKGIKGFKDKTAQAIVDGKLAFSSWLRPVKDYLEYDGSLPKKKVKVVNAEGKLYTMNVSWTTYRSKEEEARVVAEGGNIIKFGAKTDVLLYRPGGKLSTKIEKAGSKAMTWEQFCKRYSL
jgi:hypothetical protein